LHQGWTEFNFTITENGKRKFPQNFINGKRKTKNGTESPIFGGKTEYGKRKKILNQSNPVFS
jgi:hypothetical protein